MLAGARRFEWHDRQCAANRGHQHDDRLEGGIWLLSGEEPPNNLRSHARGTCKLGLGHAQSFPGHVDRSNDLVDGIHLCTCRGILACKRRRTHLLVHEFIEAGF